MSSRFDELPNRPPEACGSMDPTKATINRALEARTSEECSGSHMTHADELLLHSLAVDPRQVLTRMSPVTIAAIASHW